MIKFLKKILGIDKLESIIYQLEKDIISKERANQLEVSLKRSLNDVENIKSLFDVGLDIGMNDYHNNWAVICCNGRPEYVRFIDLKGKDIIELKRFVSRFDSSKVHIDSPFDKRFLGKW